MFRKRYRTATVRESVLFADFFTGSKGVVAFADFFNGL
jgi:hypothetical protein